MIDPDYLHNLASAAHRVGVQPSTLLQWIADGLRAMPKGKIGPSGPTNYLIKESWLTEYMEKAADREAAERAPVTKGPIKAKAKPAARRPTIGQRAAASTSSATPAEVAGFDPETR